MADRVWYPASWEPGVDGAGEYRPRGVGVELRGGPLDGRTAHVWNAAEALWLASRGSGEFVVTSGSGSPNDPPSGAVVLGRYVYSPSDRSLRWYRLEGEERQGAGAAPNPVAIPRPRFGALWQESGTPPSPVVALWRRLVSCWSRAD